MSKTIVVVSLYNRYDNLKRWVHAWQNSHIRDAKLFIVNNADPEMNTTPWEAYCKERGVTFIRRDNIGFETAIIQDVFLGRMFKEENWEFLLFATDDTIPMDRFFIHYFIEHFNAKSDLGVVCMEMSGVYVPHIRTTGFCINWPTAKNIKFKPSQITTKEECYYFEHQGKENTLMSQVLRMDKRVIQLSAVKDSVLWDTHHHEDHNRWEEWNQAFPGYKE